MLTFRCISLFWFATLISVLKKIFQNLTTASVRKCKKFNFYDCFLTNCQGNKAILFLMGLNMHLSHLGKHAKVSCSYLFATVHNQEQDWQQWCAQLTFKTAIGSCPFSQLCRIKQLSLNDLKHRDIFFLFQPLLFNMIWIFIFCFFSPTRQQEICFQNTIWINVSKTCCIYIFYFTFYLKQNYHKMVNNNCLINQKVHI